MDIVTETDGSADEQGEEGPAEDQLLFPFRPRVERQLFLLDSVGE